jgi:hypothetical protein
MRKLLIMAVVGLMAGACAQVYFASPHPQKGITVKSFLDELHGVYSDSTYVVEIMKNEMIVSGDRYQLTTKTPLDNEVLVKFYKNFYFASFLDTLHYTVFMGKFFDNKLAVYMLNADSRSIEILNNYVAVDTINANDSTYFINPSKKAFDQMIDDEIFDVLCVLEKR